MHGHCGHCPASSATGGAFCFTRGFINYVAVPLFGVILGIIRHFTPKAFSDYLHNLLPGSTNNEGLSITTADNYEKTHVITKKCVEGTSKNEHFILQSDQPNYIFGKGGLDLFELSKQDDHLFFSMCSTKIVNNTVTTIKNFDSENDQIYLSCTKQNVEESDVSVEYSKDQDVTFVKIAGKFEPTAIAFAGNYPNIMDNIAPHLNVKYTDIAGEVCPAGIDEL